MAVHRNKFIYNKNQQTH